MCKKAIVKKDVEFEIEPRNGCYGRLMERNNCNNSGEFGAPKLATFVQVGSGSVKPHFSQTFRINIHLISS